MNKTYYSFTCPKLVLATIIRFILYGGIATAFLFFVYINIKSYESCLILGLIAYAAALFRIFSYWKARVFLAFMIVKLDNEGISNRFCSISWEHIGNVGLEVLKEPAPTMLKEYDFGIMFYAQKGGPKNETDFLNHNKYNTIFFPCNDKIKKLLMEKHLI